MMKMMMRMTTTMTTMEVQYVDFDDDTKINDIKLIII
jgi:hypothetical protein